MIKNNTTKFKVVPEHKEGLTFPVYKAIFGKHWVECYITTKANNHIIKMDKEKLMEKPFNLVVAEAWTPETPEDALFLETDAENGVYHGASYKFEKVEYVSKKDGKKHLKDKVTIFDIVDIEENTDKVERAKPMTIADFIAMKDAEATTKDNTEADKLVDDMPF